VTSSGAIRLSELGLSSETSKSYDTYVSTPVMDESDESLIARLSTGDKQALALLFRRYAGVVRGVAFKVLRDASEADDMLQDIFLLIHNDCRKFDVLKSPARFWILQMTYHRAISRRRYLTSRHFYSRTDLDHAAENVFAPDGAAAPYDHSIEAHYGRAATEKMVEELSANQRETLRLHFVEGYTFDEIATKLRQSKGNIKHHYFRGLDRLRKRMFAIKGQDMA